MQNVSTARALGVLSILWAAACSTSATSPAILPDASFVSSPLDVETSRSGALRVEIRTADGQPPARGTNIFELRITVVATSQPATGLDVRVVPWMPAMGHGTSVTPTVVDRGGGSYVVSNVALFMPGAWELRTTFSSDSAPIDDIVPTFQID